MKTYGGTSASGRTRKRVGIADFAVTADGAVLATSGLGSCLGIGLRDGRAGVAGLIHVMLPTAPEDPPNVAKYADTGIDAVLDAMCAEGASPDRVRAKLVGGSAMFEFDSQDEPIGERNVAVTRATLDRLGIPVDAEDVGGNSGRSIRFHGDTGDLRIKSAGTERRI
ncbi:chemotaxis protein CheD [Haloplanus rubicundus]|uniref:Probable chemoreceptor glutamine deamidase CheD n=1 Tax=Haloplanus rubicundus TaxID=1547898 RepID=A0A345EDF7_9EURY|nr:chemotaxis protein CheD [Haloplanus rubicundus]AXG06855.1 chemotaxis protein CheD [Haloplanus rubicundus]AXG10229.1 chemotaxis protein CheD [Haloplanus rubicundus]